MLTSRVPGAEQVDDTGEETSLKNTEHDSQSRQLEPVLSEAHSNHQSTPKRRDHGEENSGSDLAADDSRGRLEDAVGGEEDERHDVLSLLTPG